MVGEGDPLRAERVHIGRPKVCAGPSEAPHRRLCWGLFFSLFSLLFTDPLNLMRRPVPNPCVRVRWRALLHIVAVNACIHNRFGQALAIATLPSPRLSGCRAPSLTLVRHQSVEIFDDLDAVTVCFIGSAGHGATVAKPERRKTQLRLNTTS